jgi:hypothetical protein
MLDFLTQTANARVRIVRSHQTAPVISQPYSVYLEPLGDFDFVQKNHRNALAIHRFAQSQFSQAPARCSTSLAQHKEWHQQPFSVNN